MLALCKKALMKKELNLQQSLYEILQILSIMIFQKDLITQVLTKNRQQNENINFYKQLSLFDLWPDSSNRKYKIPTPASGWQLVKAAKLVPP